MGKSDLRAPALVEFQGHITAVQRRRVLSSDSFREPGQFQSPEMIPAKPGKRSGFWVKFRINKGQEFVIGGFIPGSYGIDSIIVGYYHGEDLVYVARVQSGFVPATRRRVYEMLKPLVTDKCPFVNLPETGRARWGDLLDAEKMKKCVWVRPELIAQIEYLESTGGDRLRHSKFVALRDDKNPREVVKETVRKCWV